MLQIRITAIIYLLDELTSLVGAVEDLVRIRIRKATTLQIRITDIKYLVGELISLFKTVEDLVGNPDPDQRRQNVTDTDHCYNNIPAWRADKPCRGC